MPGLEIVYIVIAVLCAFVFIALGTYLFVRENGTDWNSEEYAQAGMMYLACLIGGVVWPVPLGMLLLIGVFVYLSKFMRRLVKTMENAANKR